MILGFREFARRDVQYARGRCRACGWLGSLRAYDALLWLTLLWVPVLPLGWRHVWSECPACGEARSLPVRRWREMRLVDLSDALHASEEEPAGRDAARSALAVVAELCEATALPRLSARIREHFAHDAELVGELARAHRDLGQDDEARGCYRLALEAEGPPDDREALAAELAVLDREPQAV